MLKVRDGKRNQIVTVSEAGCDVGCETEAFAPCHQLKPTKCHNCTVTLEMQLTIISIMNSSENYFLDSLKTGWFVCQNV